MKNNAPYGASVINGRLFFKLLDGSSISCNCISGVTAEKVVSACRVGEAAEIYEAAHRRILDYDRREAAGEDVSGEVRPRMPGGSDF